MADDKLLDQLTRRQTLIQRLSSGQIKKTRPIIRQLAKDIRGRVASADETEFQQRRLKVLERDIQAMVSEASDQVQGELELEDFAKDEIEFNEKLLGSHVSVELAQGVSPEVVKAITTQRTFELVSGDKVVKQTIPEMFEKFSEAAGKDAMRAVQAGVVEGKTTQELAREVATLVQTRSRRQAEAVIRTSINGIGTAARGEVYKANSDVLDGEVWTSTLDSKVTLTCAGLDQQKFPVGEGPMPPRHHNCRSLRRPSIKPEYRVGRVGKRASYDGPVDARTSFGGFLKRQPEGFQDEVLGKERADLFRSGKVNISQFTDDAGRSLTLEGLRNKYDLIAE